VPTQRLLTDSEISSFLRRHPIVAENVISTKAAIAIGLYDWDYNPAEQWRIPGIIPPWGMQQDDSSFGMVTIFPARDGRILYSAFTQELAPIDQPAYESPTGPIFGEGGIFPSYEDILGGAQTAVNVAWLVGFGLAAYVGYQMFFAKK